jgi:glycosyltransferase involved in cell wall biosynthesis
MHVARPVPIEVDDRLWIGASSCGPDAIPPQVDVVIDVTRLGGMTPPPRIKRVLRRPIIYWEDEEAFFRSMASLVREVKAFRASGESVLIVCRLGYDRSAIVALAVMVDEGMTRAEAWMALSRHVIDRPRHDAMAALDRFLEWSRQPDEHALRPRRQSALSWVIVCQGRHPFDGDGYARALGGNENTLILWTRELTTLGHKVTVEVEGLERASERDGVEWRPHDATPPSVSAANVLVAWRDARPLALAASGATRVLLLGDRETPGLPTSEAIDIVVALSETQAHRYEQLLPEGALVLVAPCGYDDRLFSYHEEEKVAGLCVHTSASYRGLSHLLRWWPSVRRQIPEAQLVVCGGYELWGYGRSKAWAMTDNDVNGLLRQPGVEFVGALPRADYAALMRSSALWLYPTTYEEMCCISALEASACGTVPIASGVAALVERIPNPGCGVRIDHPAASSTSDDAFVAATVRLLADDRYRRTMAASARDAVSLLTTRHVVKRLVDRMPVQVA